MAWLWKQGRPTLPAMVGMGALGYKAFHRGHVPVEQRQPEVGMWDAAGGAAGMRFALVTEYTALSDGPPMEKRGHNVCGMDNVRRNRRGV